MKWDDPKRNIGNHRDGVRKAIVWLNINIRDITKSNLNSIAKEAFLNQGSSSEPNTENYLKNCFLILYHGWNHPRRIGKKLIHYKQWMPEGLNTFVFCFKRLQEY